MALLPPQANRSVGTTNPVANDSPPRKVDASELDSDQFGELGSDDSHRFVCSVKTGARC